MRPHLAVVLLASIALAPGAGANASPVFTGVGTAAQTGDCSDATTVVAVQVVFNYDTTPADYPVVEWASSQACIGATWVAPMPTKCSMHGDGGFDCTQRALTTQYSLSVDAGGAFHFQLTDNGALVTDLAGSFIRV
jgi:hypothetical protein